jgi:hypothetical protein
MADQDTTPPSITFLSAPKSINVTKGDQIATFTAGALDQDSGVAYVTVHLDHAIRTGGYTTNYLIFRDGTDSFADGQSTLQQKIDSGTGAGTYSIDYADVTDKAGNITTYSADQLAAAGIGTQFKVKSQAAMDVTPPTLTGLSLPKSINVTKGDKLLSVTVRAADEGQGVGSVALHLDHAIQSGGAASQLLYFDGSVDSFADGAATLSQRIDSTTGAGPYSIDYAIVTDLANNRTYYSGSQLAGLGVDTQFTVKSQSVMDTIAPTLTGISFPRAVNVTKADQTVMVTAKAHDDGLGVSYVSLHLDHAIQSNGVATRDLFLGNGEDTFDDGAASIALKIDKSTAAGSYGVDYVAVADKAGNMRYYDGDQLEELGINARFTVKSQSATMVGQSSYSASEHLSDAWLHTGNDMLHSFLPALHLT